MLVVLLSAALPRVSHAAHQRVGTQRGSTHALSLGLRLTSQIMALSEVSEAVSLSGEAQISYAIRDVFSVTGDFPCVAEIRSAEHSGTRVVADIGDPSVWLTAFVGGSARRARIAVGYTVPLGRWDAHEIRMTGLGGGQGHHTVSTGFGLSVVRDPVVVNATAIYSVGLPRRERYATMVRPGDLNLGLSVTEVLNDRVALRFAIAGEVSLSAVPLSDIGLRRATSRISLECAVLYGRGNGSASFRIRLPLDTATAPGVTAAGAYELVWE